MLDDEVDAFLDFQVDSGRLHDAVFHSPATAAFPVDEHRSADSLIAELLRGGIADGAFADVDVDPTAVLIFHVIHGAGDDIAAGRDRERARDAALHIIRATLQPAGSEAGAPTTERLSTDAVQVCRQGRRVRPGPVPDPRRGQ